MQIRTTQLTVLPVVFVSIMVILVPCLIEEAKARIDAIAITQVGL